MKGYIFGLDSQFNMLAKYFDFICCLRLLIRYTISCINNQHTFRRPNNGKYYLWKHLQENLWIYLVKCSLICSFSQQLVYCIYKFKSQEPRLDWCRLAYLFPSKYCECVLSFVGLKIFSLFWDCSVSKWLLSKPNWISFTIFRQFGLFFSHILHVRILYFQWDRVIIFENLIFFPNFEYFLW